MTALNLVAPEPKHRFTRLLLPFSIENGPCRTSEFISFKDSFYQLGERILKYQCDVGRKKVARHVWKNRKEKRDKYILQHVHEFFFTQDQNQEPRYVLSFEINQQARPDLFSHTFDLETKKNHCTFAFNEIDLYLFRSGIGILVLDLGLRAVCDSETGAKRTEVTIEDLRNFNAEMVAWHYGTPYCLRKTKSDQDQSDDDGKTMEDYMKELLQPIGEIEQDWKPMTQNFLGFTYLFLSRGDERAGGEEDYSKLDKAFYALYHFLDEKHQPSRRQLRLEGNPNIVQTYDNIFWGLSGAGWAAVVLDNGAEYLRHQFRTRVRKNYFLLFLLGLHRQLALQRLEQCLSKVEIAMSDERSPEAFTTEVRKYRDWAFDFTLHCSFLQVSPNDYYRDLHEAWTQILGTDHGERELRSIVEELDDYLEREERKQQETARKQQEEARNKQSVMINLLNFILIPLAISATVLSLYDSAKTTPWLVLALIATSYAFTLLLRACFQRRRPPPGQGRNS